MQFMLLFLLMLIGSMSISAQTQVIKNKENEQDGLHNALLNEINSESPEWKEFFEKLKSDMASITPDLFGTNIDNPALRNMLKGWTVHPSFGFGWGRIPPPNVKGTNALASVEAFVATNGWNMTTNVPLLAFERAKKPITGLPWEGIQDRQFLAVTHDGILYVVLTGFGGECTGLAYNPNTNKFAKTISSFKPIKAHWYEWRQGPPSDIQIYEGQAVPRSVQRQAIDLRSQWDDVTPLANPHKGWYHHYPDNHIDKYKVRNDADLTNFPGMDHVYLRLAWAYLEPKEGQFNWTLVDEMVNRWTNYGFGIAFRISCRETSTDRIEQQFATPKWVMEAGAKGGHYLMGKATGPAGPWEPDFGDPVFLDKLDHFLAAFSARYDGKPWLRYIDVGSIGDWGEGHTWAGSRSECGFLVRKKHIDLYLRYFKKSQIILSDDFVYAVADMSERNQMHKYALENGIGYRDDSILVDGYLSGTSPTWTVRSPGFFEDAYRSKPTVFELEHYGTVKQSGNWEGRPGSSVEKYGHGKKGQDYFRGALELLHSSYIGYHGYAHEWLADNPELTAELLNRCGYWYFLHKIELPAEIEAGAECEIDLTWENRGVAPAYHAYKLQLRLEGPVTYSAEMPSNNRRWQPFPKGALFTENYRFTPPQLLPPGKYVVKCKLRSPEAERNVLIALNNTLMDAQGYYRLGSLDLKR